MSSLRTLLFWCHLATGVAVALVVLTMSATGVLLTYQKQMTAWADARALAPTPQAARPGLRLSLDTLVARAAAAVPGTSPTAVTVRAREGAPVEIAFGRERTLFVDAGTGIVRGEGSRATRAFFAKVTALHRWMGATGERRALGKSITGVANLGFLFLVLSGAVLWWPRNVTRAAVRNVALFRRGLSGKARDFNWHHVIGLWGWVPLVVIVASGVVISYPWAGNLVYRAAGEAPPPAPPRAEGERASPGRPRRAEPWRWSGASMDTLLARATRRVPAWRSASLAIARPGAPAVITVDAGTGGQPQRRAQLTLDAATAEETKWQPFAASSPGRRLRSFLRFAHTGEVFGVAGQTLAGLVSLGAVLLVWTGLALSWRRLRAWSARRSLSAVPRRTRSERTRAA